MYFNPNWINTTSTICKDLTRWDNCVPYGEMMKKDWPVPMKAEVVPSIPTTYPLSPTRILRSGDRTIVFWNDGTKTIVKRSPDEADNDYAAFTAALGIRMYGSNSALRRLIRNKIQIQKPKKPKKMNESEEIPGQLIFDQKGNIIGVVDEI